MVSRRFSWAVTHGRMAQTHQQEEGIKEEEEKNGIIEKHQPDLSPSGLKPAISGFYKSESYDSLTPTTDSKM